MLNKLTFKSQNLVVDWIGFNIQGLVERKQVERIAKYLFQNFGFNSTFALGSDGKQETLFSNLKNKYQVSFRAYKYSDIYWDGIKIDFSGRNGHQFYNFIAANQVNWEIFNHEKSLLCFYRIKFESSFINLQNYKQYYSNLINIMQKSNITFQNRKLTVDYITFNLQNGKSQIQEIANIFNADYSFDSYLVDQKYKNPSKEPVVVNNEYHQLVFVINSTEHKASTVLIQFSGENAAHVYNLLKSGKFYWPDFDNFDLVLGRFDINYIREEKIIDDLVFQDFGERCIQKYKARYPQAVTQPVLTTGFGLGTRKGDYFLRTYKPADNSFLKFELEIKKAKARSYHNYFLNLHQTFLQFENLIATRFYQYLRVALVLDTELTDWLVTVLRQTKKPLNSLVSNSILTTYKIQETSLVEQKNFYRLLQFLSFSRRFSYYEEILQGETFQSFSFPLVEFTKNIGLDNNYHNRQEVVRFFHSLPCLSLNQWFSEDEFQSIAAFPIVTITRKELRNNRTKLIVKVSVLKDFFSTWKYAFYFPKTFYLYDNADDRRVKLQFIESVAGEVAIRKEFRLSYFLSTLNSISNQRKSAIKKNIIKQFQILEKEALIQSEITLYQKDDNRQTLTIQELSLAQINQTKIIGFYETNKYFREQ